MSRIGKMPVLLPKSVEITVKKDEIVVKGPKGSLNQWIPEHIIVAQKDNSLCVHIRDESKQYWAQWGLYRVLIANMVKGVTDGFQKTLEIEGVGYKAELKGKNLVVSAGYSHAYLYKVPNNISVTTEGTTKVLISGIDKQAVGQAAAQIRSIRRPEPYKAKGIRYQGEKIVRKAGKVGTK